MTVEQTKQAMLGDWASIAPEIRPGTSKDANGNIKPFYLTRAFRYLAGDQFELTVINSADAYGKVPLVKMLIKGHMVWQGEHPIAPGAYQGDFIADGAYEVTPLLQGFADVVNQIAGNGYGKWEVNSAQSILGKAFAPFGLSEGQIFMEYDLVYVLNDLMFW